MLPSIMDQNHDLGLSVKEINDSNLVFKTGPRYRETVHWVLETNSATHAKIRNKRVFCGYFGCKISEFNRVTQCLRCQNFGHIAGKCRVLNPNCRFCSGNHDSKNCPDTGKVKCVNCCGKHAAMNSKCARKEQAITNLLRNTDFGEKNK